MSTPVVIRGLAQSDLEEAAAWYDSRQFELGEELVGQVGSTISAVADRPESFPIAYARRTRRALVKRFPFAVYFILEPKRIVILAILHTRREHKRLLRGRSV